MGDPKETTNGTGKNTVGQDLSHNNIYDGEIITSVKNQSNSSPNQGKRGGKKRNNRKSAAMSTANKDFKGEIETFVAVLVLRYKKVDLKKSFRFFL